MYLVEVNCREQRPSLHVTLSSPCFLPSSSLSLFNKGKNPVVTKLRTDQIRVVIGWSGWMHTGSHVLLQPQMCPTGVWFLTLHLCRSHFFFLYRSNIKVLLTQPTDHTPQPHRDEADTRARVRVKDSILVSGPTFQRLTLHLHLYCHFLRRTSNAEVWRARKDPSCVARGLVGWVELSPWRLCFVSKDIMWLNVVISAQRMIFS